MSCDYCDEQQGIETVYNRIYGSRNRIVYQTKSFLVFPCMGQLREGHLLAVSKAHVNAIGMLDMDTISELERLVSDIAAFFQDTYQQNLLCFEHGVLDDGGANGGCGIYHMHLHLLPANQKEFSEVLELLYSDKANIINPSAKLSDAYHYISNKKTYTYLSFLGQKKLNGYFVTNYRNFFESQYMRRIVCKVIGNPDWDWRHIKQPEKDLINTLNKSRLFFKDNQLPLNLGISDL